VQHGPFATVSKGATALVHVTYQILTY